ncbi:Ankyrin-repeat containing protein, substrate of the Dot/Icm secretion system [Legionella quinlivanii]|uniref:Ankyrin-repeat containing protein, substrate of the Dot/Icm secretion system n=1 Tax=Legionella quinlivanii TaxID=45073 RepID=A0A0W0Y0I4_9GAMM|nr:Dot/Icm T4SS effector AnkY/LegA9 [Legionella quinlivanii]KTD50224.1 Ankyrin-repeat containing protein, substrate of the Dot/Icm secretion system [Legionella quinlivanii]SEF46875.1 Ankyrin repeat-containing protein [Legionella quinlivanii DSM 21216]STY11822.1 Ankyrin-repeat containing protein. Substrate of the Dot/Icm secretion system [Legionella quinlivanii]
MSKFIAIFAQCLSPTASGDYMLAIQIAKSLHQTLVSNNPENIQLVLTTTRESMHHYQALCGSHLTELGISVIALEDLTDEQNSMLAFIDANRCKPADGNLMLAAFSPETKYIFAGAPNAPDFSEDWMTQEIDFQNYLDQPELFFYLPPSQKIFSSTGLGPDRLGITAITPLNQLPLLNEEQAALIPNRAYSFAYVNNHNFNASWKAITNYTEITGQHQLMLLGDFSTQEIDFLRGKMNEILLAQGNIEPAVIHHHAIVENKLMRQLMSHSSGDLIVTTGTQSTLEAFVDQKLPFYQYTEHNADFVDSYLETLRSLLLLRMSDSPQTRKIVILFAELLFAAKPLENADSEYLKSCLGKNLLCQIMKTANAEIVATAQGRLGPRLLGFINQNNPSALQELEEKYLRVCVTLLKRGESEYPDLDEALRRAASKGMVFELKVLLQRIKTHNEELDEPDERFGRSALLWAVIKKQATCMRLLLKAGSDVNFQDDMGETAAHYAVRLKRKDLLEICIREGADLSVRDKKHMTVLHHASRLGLDDIVAFLITSGASVDVMNKQRNTPLHLALQGRNKTEVIRHLVDAGANPRIRNHSGRKACDNPVFIQFMKTQNSKEKNKEEAAHVALNESFPISCTHAMSC